MSDSQIAFLDTTVKIDSDNSLYTTLYEKPTDTHLYLHYTSAHHAPSKTKGPYGQFLRLRRICAKNEDFEHSCEKLIGYYLKRGYPLKALRNHKKAASKYTQDELLEVKAKDTTQTPVMVTGYNPGNPDIKGLIHKNWNIISNSQDLKQIFPSKPILGFRRLPNLRDQLTSAKIDYPPTNRIRVDPRPKVCTRLGKCKYAP